MMKRIILASHNPVKADAVRRGFQLVFPHDQFLFQSVYVESGVPDQPMTDQTAREGAFNRARNAKTAFPESDY